MTQDCFLLTRNYHTKGFQRKTLKNHWAREVVVFLGILRMGHDRICVQATLVPD